LLILLAEEKALEIPQGFLVFVAKFAKLGGRELVYVMSELLQSKVRDDVARALWRLGHACVSDLVTHVRGVRRAEELIAILNEMVRDGVLVLERKGESPERNVYALK
jgi:hypothetical protein